MSEAKKPLAVGDRVRVYGGDGFGGAWGGIVQRLEAWTHWGVGIAIESTFNNEIYIVHPKQVRRLVRKPKRERREWTMTKQPCHCLVALAISSNHKCVTDVSGPELRQGETVRVREVAKPKAVRG